MQSLADPGAIESDRVDAVTVLLYGALTEAAINLQTPASTRTADEFIDTAQQFLRGVAPAARSSRRRRRAGAVSS